MHTVLHERKAGAQSKNSRPMSATVLAVTSYKGPLQAFVPFTGETDENRSCLQLRLVATADPMVHPIAGRDT